MGDEMAQEKQKEPTSADEVMAKLYADKLLELQALVAKEAALHYAILAKGKALAVIGADIGKFPNVGKMQSEARKLVKAAIDEKKKK